MIKYIALHLFCLITLSVTAGRGESCSTILTIILVILLLEDLYVMEQSAMHHFNFHNVKIIIKAEV